MLLFLTSLLPSETTLLSTFAALLPTVTVCNEFCTRFQWPTTSGPASDFVSLICSLMVFVFTFIAMMFPFGFLHRIVCASSKNLVACV